MKNSPAHIRIWNWATRYICRISRSFSVARISQNGKFDKSSTDKWYTGLESEVAIKMQNWQCAREDYDTSRLLNLGRP